MGFIPAKAFWVRYISIWYSNHDLETVPYTTTPAKAEVKKVTPEENKKNIENHKKIATLLESAAKHHIEAANHHEKENHEKAAQSTIAAHGHTALAHEAQKDGVKMHALNS